MTWKPAFFEALQRASITPGYRLRFMDTSAVGLPAGGIAFASTAGALRVGREGPNIQGTRVIPGRWNVTFGSFSVPMVGDIRPYRQTLRRGQFAYVEVDIGTGWEILCMGQLRTITKIGPKFMFGFVDLLSALTSNASATLTAGSPPSSASYDPPKTQLFRFLGRTTTTTGAYTAGGGSLSVAELRYFQQETGEDGVILCTPAGGGNDFVMRFSGRSATSGAGTLTISADTGIIYPSEFTCPGTLGSGSTITSIALAKGWPGHILGKILASTGTGTNGILDKYPLSWSVGGAFNPDIYDYGDSQNQQSYIRTADTATTSTYRWDLKLAAPFGAGLRDLTSQAALCGQWPVFRQGRISWRGCVDPEGLIGSSEGIQPLLVGAIRDSDILGVVSHDFFNPDLGNIYGWSRLVYGIDSTGAEKDFYFKIVAGGKVLSLPAAELIERDNRYTYKGNPKTVGGLTDRANRGQGDLLRMHAWDNLTHERLVLRLHLSHCGLVAGDIVQLSSSILYGIGESDGQTYRQRNAMVISSGFDLARRSAAIGLAILPNKRGD